MVGKPVAVKGWALWYYYTARIFAGPTVEIVDRRWNYGEERIRAIGEIDGRVYVVIYTDRLRVRWIISAWKASGKDVRTWRDRQ
jgi:uncharacterized DUF497 family protein